MKIKNFITIVAITISVSCCPLQNDSKDPQNYTENEEISMKSKQTQEAPEQEPLQREIEPFSSIPDFMIAIFIDYLPPVTTMLGEDLRTGAYVVAAVGIVQILFYGCTLFMRLSYMLTSIWVLVVLYSVISAMLFMGLKTNNILLMILWVIYALFFVFMMLIMMVFMSILLCVRREYVRLICVAFAVLWYLMTLYFICVVNSYRLQVQGKIPDLASLPNLPDANIKNIPNIPI